MANFTLTMMTYRDNLKTGHHDVPDKVVTKEFDTAEHMSAFWEHNKSFEREGDELRRKRKKIRRQQREQQERVLQDKLEQIRQETIDELIAFARRSVE